MSDCSFDTLSLSDALRRAISEHYTEMTPIQAQTIPLVLNGCDVIGRSSTGTGKTAAFAIPVLEKILRCPEDLSCALVICPTRELAMQIAGEFRKLAKYTENLKTAAVYGGQSMLIQIRQLKTARIIIGTPGRIMDHMQRRTLRPENVSVCVLDEADEMLNMGFLEDIRRILSAMPPDRQTLLFSATMPPEILALAQEFQHAPEMVAADSGRRTIDTVSQFFCRTPHSRKKDALNLLLRALHPMRSVVFCNTKKMVDELLEYLTASGFSCAGLHGDMRQSLRTQVMQAFKAGELSILIATDVAARGIDVPSVDTVFNFDVPQENEYYIHRIGRTGRAGKSGAAYTLAGCFEDLERISMIAQHIRMEIREIPLPSRESLLKELRCQIVAKAKALSVPPAEDDFLDALFSDFNSAGISERDAFRALAFQCFGDRIRVIPDIPEIPDFRPPEKHRKARTEGVVKEPKKIENSVRLKVNIGRNQHIAPNFIMGAIAEKTGISGKEIGRIDILDDCSLVELAPDAAEQVLQAMQHTRIKNFWVHFSKASAQNIGEKKKAPKKDAPKKPKSGPRALHKKEKAPRRKTHAAPKSKKHR